MKAFVYPEQALVGSGPTMELGRSGRPMMTAPVERSQLRGLVDNDRQIPQHRHVTQRAHLVSCLRIDSNSRRRFALVFG